MRYNDLIVNRKIDNKKINVLLHNSARMIDELVNYGSLLLDKICSRQNFTEVHSVFQTLYVQFLSLVDSAAILVKNGHGDGLKPISRSILEISLNLQYLMTGNFDENCIAYQVTEVRGRIKEYKKFINESQDGEKTKSLYAKIGFNVGSIDFQKKIDNLENMLKREPYKTMNEQYNTVKRTYGRLQQWYTVQDISLKTVRDLAVHLDKEIYYEIIYKPYSNYSHGGVALKRVAVVDEKAMALPHIRAYDNIPSSAAIIIGIVRETLNQAVDSLVEEERENFENWYKKEISVDLVNLSMSEIKTNYKIK